MSKQRLHLALASVAVGLMALCTGPVEAFPLTGMVGAGSSTASADNDFLYLVARRSPWIYQRHGGGYHGNWHGGNHGNWHGGNHGNWHGGYYGHNDHYNNNYFWPGYGAGLLWGLGSGLYFGGYGAPYYGGGYYGGGYGSGYYGASGSHEAWCFRRYRSYDPDSDTFMGYDGRRHYCRGPY